MSKSEVLRFPPESVCIPQITSWKLCYQKADKALYYVKQNGKNQFFFYQQIDRKELLTSSTGKDLQSVANPCGKWHPTFGAMDLNYRDFARQYEYMSQLSIRSQCHCYLVMVTMETAVDTIPNIEAIEQALECIEKAIRQKIRRVDICTRYSSMQYLIILFEPTETEIPHIMDRIFMQYRQQCDNTDFRPTYEYLAIAGENSKFILIFSYYFSLLPRQQLSDVTKQKHYRFITKNILSSFFRKLILFFNFCDGTLYYKFLQLFRALPNAFLVGGVSAK